MNEELLKRLDLLAAKLGTTAQFLWSVLLRQARVEIATDIATLVIGALLVALCVRWWLSLKRRADEHCWLDMNTGEMMGAVLVSIGSSLMFLAGVWCLCFEIPTLIFNPQFWALQQVLNTVASK